MTKYQVLAKDAHQDGWIEIGEPVEANSRQQAIRKVVETLDPAKVTGQWQAVPVSSWPKPLQVNVETETKVTFK